MIYLSIFHVTNLCIKRFIFLYFPHPTSVRDLPERIMSRGKKLLGCCRSASAYMF